MRMYLKNRKKSKKKSLKLKLFLVFIIILILLYLFNIFSKSLNHYYLNYSENEASRLIMNSILKSVNEETLLEMKGNNLYKVIRNKENEIEMIDYNSYLINTFLKNITNNVTQYLVKEEEKSNKASFYIPMGSVFQNPILNNRGPCIPVRMELVGSVLTGINSKVTDYGINNSLIEVFVHIEVTERIILPADAKNIKVKYDIPISYRIIKGKVPSYYSGNSNSSYIVPME